MVLNILITGSSGFCGSFLKDHFLKNRTHNIYKLSRSQENGNHVVFDLKNPIPTSLFPEKIDCILHCASIVDEKSSNYSIFEDNLKIAYNIQNFVQEKSPNSMINLSSISIYGTPNSENIDESFTNKPKSTYGISKLLIEHLFNAMIPDSTNLVNLRLGYVIGPNIPQHSILSRFHHMLKNNQEISLINPDTTKFSFIDLFDIAKTCELIINKKLNGTFNLVGDESYTLRKIFEMIKSFSPNYNQNVQESKNPNIEFSTTFSNKKIKRFGISFKTCDDSFKEIFPSGEI
jgi:nucleoside-diphosphate-sugar epimerase